MYVFSKSSFWTIFRCTACSKTAMKFSKTCYSRFRCNFEKTFILHRNNVFLKILKISKVWIKIIKDLYKSLPRRIIEVAQRKPHIIIKTRKTMQFYLIFIFFFCYFILKVPYHFIYTKFHFYFFFFLYK